jgi:hypothetical protein
VFILLSMAEVDGKTADDGDPFPDAGTELNRNTFPPDLADSMLLTRKLWESI